MESDTPPKLVQRRKNRKSTMRIGRTIGAKREHLETASERSAAHKKNQTKRRWRLFGTIVVFGVAILLVCTILVQLFRKTTMDEAISETIILPITPTIEIVDESMSDAGSRITSRMKEYIGQAEASFREFGYIPIKAVIPVGSIREVNFYLEGRPGYIKTIIDRGSGVSIEDADRMIRYLESQGVSEYQYIDVRIEGKAYWK